jgi:NADPH:quinone reductase-like Zn-dependent oxidoreductase
MTKKIDKKRLVVRLVAILAIIALAVVMFIIGRGHTVYFDNKEIEYNGKTYGTKYSVEVLVNGEKVAKLKDGDRGMANTMGQNFSMELLVKEEKGGNAQKMKVGLPLPYNMDGIIINLPALMAGLPSDAYMSEFIPVPSDEELQDEEVVTDEMEGLMNFGESSDE